MKTISRASSLALLLAGTVFSTSIASARPMTAEDLATLKRVGSVAVSPDEKSLAFGVTETDRQSYERSSALYLLDLTTANATPVRIADQADASEHSPAFSADGKSLYYLSDVNETEQLWMINLTTGGQEGEPVQASDLKADIAGFKLSPKGDKVAIWGDVAKGCPTFGCDATEGGDGNRALPGPGTGREYEELFVRHWSSWETPGNYSRIFAFDLQEGKLAGNGTPMDGDLIGDSPSKPFGGGEEISWSPNGKGLAFTLRKADRNEPKSTDLDIYGVALSSGEPNPMPGNGDATDTLPAFSPDDEWLAWAAMERPGYESDRKVVKLLRKGEKEPLVLTGDWDRSVSSITWTPDSRALIVTASEILDYAAFRVNIDDGKVTRLTDKGSVGNITPLEDGSMIFTKKSLQAPDDIYRRAADGTVTQLTNINGNALAEIDEVAVERFSFKGAEGAEVWGQIIKPEGAKGKLPMAFLVHGGPQGSFGDSWSTRWNPKVMASQGYAVVTIDFHGSAGYGQEFMDSINQDWGGKPLEDLKLGHAAALKIDKQIDGTRSCALGASYGGYMMNWIAGQWPDQFDCIINHAGIFDLRSFAFSTEELWFDQWDHGGPWWERPNPEKWNPIQHIDKWKTPTLFIHGEKDFRIPYTQSLMPFTYAQERNIPSKLLIFPDENHWVLKGKNSVQWHNNVFDWMARWTKESESK
ncbi:S9 family peptidase [Parasphingorhabdus cellanae]|uniref:S9 family peptidase n=1 Tax=Parasphingorhabdus cellanae TaxID=2806553 RepID=A0ABX7T8P5_9SPHN|nr:S9 family peptidase [Parasphingorhabdus cellanae]QTD56867.1 S9 family peptidase [Parasphingorhabdus cellanae]